jgi:hypothetical protein
LKVYHTPEKLPAKCCIAGVVSSSAYPIYKIFKNVILKVQINGSDFATPFLFKPRKS